MSMKALSDGDAMFLYAETPEQHQHMIGIIVLGPATAPASFSVQDLINKKDACGVVGVNKQEDV